MKHTGNNEKFIQNFVSEECEGEEPRLGYSGVGEWIVNKYYTNVVDSIKMTRGCGFVVYGRFHWRAIVSSIPITRYYSRRTIS
jgi:hypothetical protein